MGCWRDGIGIGPRAGGLAGQAKVLRIGFEPKAYTGPKNISCPEDRGACAENVVAFVIADAADEAWVWVGGIGACGDVHVGA